MKLPDAQLSHLGLYVRDMGQMVSFYRDLMGMVMTDTGISSRGSPIAFLSRSDREHHQLVLVHGREQDCSPVNQISFRIENLEGLRQFHRRVLDIGAAVERCLNHGNSWSIYCRDPEGNRLELYAASPWYVSQPFAHPLDLSQPIEEIMAATESLARQDPSFKPMSEWSAEMREKIARLE